MQQSEGRAREAVREEKGAKGQQEEEERGGKEGVVVLSSSLVSLPSLSSSLVLLLHPSSLSFTAATSLEGTIKLTFLARFQRSLWNLDSLHNERVVHSSTSLLLSISRPTEARSHHRFRYRKRRRLSSLGFRFIFCW